MSTCFWWNCHAFRFYSFFCFHVICPYRRILTII
jgi:hypothetical protein